MAQPIWQTAAGSLGVIPEGVFYQQNLVATDPDLGPVTYSVIAGVLPAGIQCTTTGQIVGVPQAAASVQGVPVSVNQDVTSKFVVRATATGRIADRTFEITVTGNDVPQFITPAGSIGTFYDGGEVNIQIQYTDADPTDVTVVSLAAGALPGGLTLSATGLISGYIEPANPIDQTPGYDESAVGVEPYDFVTEYQSRNYQFTLEVTDGKSNDLRTFTMFVYARNEMTADTTQITADNDFVTADETNNRAPFLTNANPSNLGSVRSSNYYAYEFLGNDYDTTNISYAISVNEGFGLPPGLTLDPTTGWLYGDIPDQGTTEVEYSFNITVYQTAGIGSPISCTATTTTTNRITCADTSALGVGQPIKFSGTGLGGLSTNANTLYYVLAVISSTQFTVAASPTSTSAVELTTSSGSMSAAVVVSSEPYPFTLSIVGAVDSEITWLTDADLGTLINGETSLLRIEAVNRGGRELQYQLASGEFNSLPQGLELLPSGDIAGRVTFNTFAIDLGATTIDDNTTTWDSAFTFTVNAYAPATRQTLYNVSEINIVNGGTGYDSGNPPVLQFLPAPIGASAVQATVGEITIVAGAITDVVVSNRGAGYTGDTGSANAPELIEISGPGTDAEFEVVMEATGTRDVVSVFKTFTVRVIREYNAPYQNLYVQAMPPQNDRELIDSLLNNENIFVPEYIFRPTDPNFGKSTQVVYQHAFGLAPDALDVYVESLYLNHYWKNLVLGQVETAVARDENDNIIYEVVYSKIIDNLVNDAGQSVSKIVNLPYAIIDPADGSSEITQVYPNSLINMRNQVIDTVGQISTGLPLWMTSKQTDGRVLGFTPAWVIAYVNPGRGAQVAYYLDTQFGQQLNKVDFKVDRYILDRSLTVNWDTTTQDWTPQPSLTTFDRFDTGVNTFIGNVSIATNLAFSDVNQKTLTYIRDLGGLDGQILNIDGNTIIFVKQENFDGPPGSNYPDADSAFQDYETLYDGGRYDQGPGTTPSDPDYPIQSFDESRTVSGGDILACTATDGATNLITYTNTSGSPKVYPGLPMTFSGSVFGGMTTGLYVVLTAPNNTTFTVAKASPVTAVEASTSLITVTNITGFDVGDAVQFYQTTFGGLVTGTTYYILTKSIISGTTAQITVSLSPSGVRETLSTGVGSCLMYGTTVDLSTDAGAMSATTYNERMAIYQISVDPISEIVVLTLVDQTASNEYVQISRGTEYRSAQLYRPTIAGENLTRISWLPLITTGTTPPYTIGSKYQIITVGTTNWTAIGASANEVGIVFTATGPGTGTGTAKSIETTFDGGSVEFIQPVDMYDPGDSNDKYLVFPKTNILV
jgi:hypothetical protein